MSEYPIGSTAKIYHLADGSEVTLRRLIAKEPEWAQNRIIEGEKSEAENIILRDALKQIYDNAQFEEMYCQKCGDSEPMKDCDYVSIAAAALGIS